MHWIHKVHIYIHTVFHILHIHTRTYRQFIPHTVSVLHKGNNYHISCCIGFACTYILYIYTVLYMYVGHVHVHLQQTYEQKWNFERECYVQCGKVPWKCALLYNWVLAALRARSLRVPDFLGSLTCKVFLNVFL